MSEKKAATSFNPAFLESLKKKNKNCWKCPKCYSFNDNSLTQCRSCEADKPSDLPPAPSPSNPPAQQDTTGGEKKAATSFNPAFLESLKKKNQNCWKCPKCYSFNDNNLTQCRSCEADKPNCTSSESSSVKRPAEDGSSSDEKKPKVTGFVFKPTGDVKIKSLFDSVATNAQSSTTAPSFPSVFKFGVGDKAVALNLPQPKEKENGESTDSKIQNEEAKKPNEDSKQADNAKESSKPGKEDSDSDCMKYESDDDAHGTVPEQDYSEDEKCPDVMKGRKSVSFAKCTTAKTPLSKNSRSYEVYVFGSGDCGQLGLNMDVIQAGKPVRHAKATDLKVTRILSGGLFNVVVGSDKKSLYTWGCNDECQLGRDGDELTPLPVSRGQLPADDPIEQVATGACHVVVLTKSGSVYCWGTYRDSKGILGWSTNVKKQDKPTKIAFPRGVVITSVCCGENHTLALAKDGTLYGWGCDEQGQLEFRMPESMKRRALTPHALCFREGRNRIPVKAMWAGGMHSMVLLENGHLMTFGLNNWGQLGKGYRSEEVVEPARITFFDDKTIVQMALSQHATAVLVDDGSVYTVGRNSYGQLGRKSRNEEFDIRFGKVEFPEGVKIQQIASGNHHLLAVDEKGLLYTWGFGDMEQLGNGKYEDEACPYHVRSKELAGRRVVMVDGGAQHSVLLAEKL